MRLTLFCGSIAREITGSGTNIDSWNNTMPGFTISVPVFILPIFQQLLLRNGKISSKSFALNRANTTCKQQMTTKLFHNFLNKFNTINFQIGIILRFNCYQQPNQVLLNNKEREFSADAIWLSQVVRFTMAYRWKSIQMD